MADRIPIEIRQDILDVLEFVEPRLPNCPAKQQTYLFEVYNMYIKPPYNADIKEDCGGCRSEVLNKIRFVARQWKTQGENS